MSIFGFSTETTGGGDFLPVTKFDARSGLWFRIDRVDDGGGFMSKPIDITRGFKAMFDLENLETGWIAFPLGAAPQFTLIPMNDLLAGRRAFPDRPGDNYKQGVRFLVKLAKNCSGDRPVREVAGTAKAFLSGIEALYNEYRKDAGANPGKLPVVVMDGIDLIKTGSGQKTSSNYRPKLSILSWGPRGDLVHIPRGGSADASEVPIRPLTSNGAAPSTGATRAAAPQPGGFDASDFG